LLLLLFFASKNYSPALVLPRVPKAVDDGQIMSSTMKDPQPANGAEKFTRHCMVFGNRHVFSVLNTTKEGDDGESEREKERARAVDASSENSRKSQTMFQETDDSYPPAMVLACGITKPQGCRSPRRID
jgi:hypothetical protein